MPRIGPRRDKESQFRQEGRDSVTPSTERSTVFDSVRRLFTGDELSKTRLPKGLLEKLEPIWDTTIVPVLIKEFGIENTLYAIVYADSSAGEVIMEIWDPKAVNSKPSQMFKFRGISQGEVRQLSRDRSRAKIMILENWFPTY